MFSLHASYWHVVFFWNHVWKSSSARSLIQFLVVWVLSHIFSKRTLPSPKPRPISFSPSSEMVHSLFLPSAHRAIATQSGLTSRQTEIGRRAVKRGGCEPGGPADSGPTHLMEEERQLLHCPLLSHTASMMAVSSHSTEGFLFCFVFVMKERRIEREDFLFVVWPVSPWTRTQPQLRVDQVH